MVWKKEVKGGRNLLNWQSKISYVDWGNVRAGEGGQMCDLHGHNFYPNPRLFRLAGEGSKYAVPNSHVLNRNQPSLFSRGRGVVMFKLRGEGKMCNLHVLPNDLIFNPNQPRFPDWG